MDNGGLPLVPQFETALESKNLSSINSKKPLLQFVNKVTVNKKKNSGGSEKWVCKLCNHSFKGSYTRVMHHLMGIFGEGVRPCACPFEKKVEMNKFNAIATGENLEEDDSSSMLKKQRVSSSMEDQTDFLGVSSPSISTRKGKTHSDVVEMFNGQRREEVEDAVVEFFFGNGISFNACCSLLYKEMFKKALAVGPSFQPPGYNKMRTIMLDRGVTKMQGLMEGLQKTWAKSGCSIVMDGWTNIQQRPLLNIIVTSKSGPYFLRAVDCSGKMKDAGYQFEVLKEAIEEMQVIN